VIGLVWIGGDGLLRDATNIDPGVQRNSCMDDVSFWQIIEEIKNHHDDNACSKALASRLRRLPADEVLAFHRYFERLSIVVAGIGDAWIAASLLNGRLCGDDCFEYFRNWLIAQGREVYQTALDNWDSLADLDLHKDDAVQVAQFERFGEVAARFYKAATGKYPPVETNQEADLESWTWTDFTEDYLADRFPKLWSKYGHLKKELDESIRCANEILLQHTRAECVIPGVGIVRVGSVISHKAYGHAVVKQIIDYRDGTFAAEVEYAGGKDQVLLSPDYFSLVK
jgi:hypothetical protein